MHSSTRVRKSDVRKQRQPRKQNNWPAEVQAFCRDRGIVSALRVGIELVRNHFGSERIQLEIEADPDTGNRYVTINVCVDGGVHGVLDAYHRFTKEWIVTVPDNKRLQIGVFYYFSTS